MCFNLQYECKKNLSISYAQIQSTILVCIGPWR